MTTLITAVAVGLLFVAPPSARRMDVTGKWDLTVNTEQGVRSGTLKVSTRGDALAGVISSPQGEIPVEVSLKDKAITMAFSFPTENGSIEISMTGAVDGDQMSGELSLGDFGTGTWSAKRAATQPGQNPPAGQEKPAPTMTGTWVLEAYYPAGTSTPTVIITQTGEKLTGKYVGSRGEIELIGSIKDNKEFTFELGTEQKVGIVYTGTFDGDTIKGSITATMGEMGEGTFTGKRK